MKLQSHIRDYTDLAGLKRRILRSTRSELRKMGMEPPKMRIGFSKSTLCHGDLFIKKHSGHLALDFSAPYPLHNTHIYRARTYVAVYLLSQCPQEVSSFPIDIGDGQSPSVMKFAFSSNRPEAVLVPDLYFVATRGFSELRQVADSANHDWSSRKTTLRWRGTDTGSGRKICGKEIINDPTINARIRMCTISAALPDTDCKFASTEIAKNRKLYEASDLFGQPIPEADWINDRYAIDVDGHTNTWSNMIARMHLGCCVLKVESQFGYRQWYYDRLKPGIHYIPVKADMSDLGKKLEWVRANPDQAEKIAFAGQQFVRSMTLESETRVAVDTICRAWA